MKKEDFCEHENPAEMTPFPSGVRICAVCMKPVPWIGNFEQFKLERLIISTCQWAKSVGDL